VFSLRQRYYIIFVAREEDGKLRKIPVPLHYAYIFLAAALVGLFTITGMAGSYSRMLLKTSRFNEVRSQQEALRHDYNHMQQVAKEKDIQAASLGSLANQITALYGLRQSKLAKAFLPSTAADSKTPMTVATAKASGVANPASGALDSDEFTQQQYHQSLDQFYTLRESAMSGRMTRSLESTYGGLLDSDSLFNVASAPSLWPVLGVVTSSFGERMDPFNGEGAFHKGIDIATANGTPVRASADGVVLVAAMANGYGREVRIDHGHGIETLYGHMSGFAVVTGEEVKRGEIIGYVGSSGRSTGPHLHYEVLIHDTPVNPHKYLRETMNDLASAQLASASHPGGE
jgi:murein DD-endopeptidase MepM/ murein hydrolase activator NlpD